MNKLLYIGWLLALLGMLSFEPVRTLMLGMVALGVALMFGGILLGGVAVVLKGFVRGWTQSEHGEIQQLPRFRTLP